jgi:DNA invertase Pin-like site-specific DNA recombinase
MSKIFLYSRVSTSQQTLEQQERTAYEWLDSHHMKVDEVVSDEGVSGGVSYADRKLGKELLPKTENGDMIIVSEISRLGRSMYDLSKLIHKELKPRRLRLVVVSMGIDLRCDKLTAIDELILNNFSFAAQLEKQLISERTLSALEVKRKQGIKLGSASPKYRANYNNKSKEQLKAEQMKRGETKRIRHQQSRDVQAFKKILRQVFPNDTIKENPQEWIWSNINTKNGNRAKILGMMKTMKEIDDTNSLFRRWDFDMDDRSLTCKLSAYICAFKKSFRV